MANSFQTFTSTASQTDFVVTDVDFSRSDEIVVYLDGAVKALSTHYSVTADGTSGANPYTVSFNNPLSADEAIRIERNTKLSNSDGTNAPRVSYSPGSSLLADDLNTSNEQVLNTLIEHGEAIDDFRTLRAYVKGPAGQTGSSTFSYGPASSAAALQLTNINAPSSLGAFVGSTYVSLLAGTYEIELSICIYNPSSSNTVPLSFYLWDSTGTDYVGGYGGNTLVPLTYHPTSGAAGRLTASASSTTATLGVTSLIQIFGGPAYGGSASAAWSNLQILDGLIKVVKIG